MRLYKNIINCIIFYFSLTMFNCYAQSTSLLQNSFLPPLEQKLETKTILQYGKLKGQVYVPEGVDPSTVVVQVGGINNFNNTSEDFYTYADKQGHFQFENTFPVGSSLNLIFWDQEGVLNKRAMPVYVSKNPGVYSVFLEKTSIINDLAVTFGVNQELNKAGMCGKITGLQSHEIIGSEVYLQDSRNENIFAAKYFDDNQLPNLNQNYLNTNGNFCFFNVDSSDNSYLYSLRLKLNTGKFKTFFVYLPPYTFATNIEYDAGSVLRLPVQIHAWDNTQYSYYKFHENTSVINWHSVYDVYFSTSYDDAPSNYTEHSKEELIDFPLGDEFLNINYSLLDEPQNHFFIFQPRSALFSKRLINAIKDYSPGQIYVDKNDPYVLKIFDPDTLRGSRSAYLSPLFNENLGSVFLNIDTTDFAFDKKQVKVYLKNISGEDVSYFFALDGVPGRKDISGFFYNIPAGLYHIFVTVPTSDSNCDNCTTFNSNQKLLWTSLVESLPNKTQVLTNISDNKILIESTLEAQEKDNVYITSKNINNNNNLIADIIPSGGNYEISLIQSNYAFLAEIEYLKEHSLFYKIDDTKLCSVPVKQIQPSPLIMGLVPLVNLVPHFKLQAQNRQNLDRIIFPIFS